MQVAETPSKYINGIPIYYGRSPACDAMDERLNGGRPSLGYWNAWNGGIYCVGVGDPPSYVVEHEKVHFRQMEEAESVDAWWERYLSDEDFRIEVEVEAYMVDIQAGVHSPDSVAYGLTTNLYGNCDYDKAYACVERWMDKLGIKWELI